jgi:cytochrome bd ubiquinol oxidase subunit II
MDALIGHPRWRGVWDGCLVFGSFAPALLLGVAFANIFRGIPIDQLGVFQGGLFTLLNPYGILGGVFFLVMFMVHGLLWLVIKSEGDLHRRAASMAKKLWVALAVLAVAFLVATWFSTRLYDNYLQNPILFMVPIVLIPIIAVAALFLIRFYMGREHWWMAWFSSSALILGVTFFGVAGLYPNLLPSSLNPAYSMTIYNSSSSQLTLKIMLGVALTFVPIIIGYQAWVYNFFKGKIREEDLAHEEGY